MLRRLLGRRRRAVAGLILVVAMMVVALLGPMVTARGLNDRDFTAFLQPPSARHWFGTSPSGADLFAEVLHGMRRSLAIGLLTAGLATGLAALIGSFAGYFGGWADRILMWSADILLVLPSLLIVSALYPSFHDKSWLHLAVLLALLQWMITGRVVRNSVRSLRERDYMRAARYLGVPALRIVVRHVLPALAPLLITDAAVNVAGAVVGEAALSYLGFGTQPPDISLGTLIADGSPAFLTSPWLFLFPALMLVAIVWSVTLAGDGLRDALDPHTPR